MQDGMTPLISAAEHNRVEAVQVLLDCEGVRIDHIDKVRPSFDPHLTGQRPNPKGRPLATGLEPMKAMIERRLPHAGKLK